MKKRGLNPNPRLSDLMPPDEWPGVPSCAVLLSEALKAGKHIHVWGDYDADGITSTVIAIRVLRQIEGLNNFGCRFSWHLPLREGEGYGVNEKGVEAAAQNGANTILTVDCGVSSVEAIKRALDLGLEIIVTDHHEPGGILPKAHGICDPALDPEHSEKMIDIAGAGQIFILLAAACGILENEGYKTPDIRGQLDLVALGSIVDVSPMVGQNRILCSIGMDLLGMVRRPGIQALKRVSGLPETGFIMSKDIAFSLGPRINAAGRMAEADIAFKCLMAEDDSSAGIFAGMLDSLNRQRKDLEKKIAMEAEKQAEKLLDKNPDLSALVLHDSAWPGGIVGIVASRVVERFGLPAVVLCGKGKGSARSDGITNISAALGSCSGLLSRHGGHKMAAGIELSAISVLDRFRHDFSNACAVMRAGKQAERDTIFGNISEYRSCEAIFPCSGLNMEDIMQISLLEPFGPGNPPPEFLSEEMVFEGADDAGKLFYLNFRTGEGERLRFKKFRLHPCPGEINAELAGKRVNFAYTPELSHFMDETTININVLKIFEA